MVEDDEVRHRLLEPLERLGGAVGCRQPVVAQGFGDLVWWEVINEIPVTTDAQGHSSTSFFDDNPDRRFYRIKDVAL